MHRLAVDRERLHGAMRVMEDRPARRLVNATRLHADKAVLHQVDAANTIVVAKLVELRQQGSR